MNNMLTLQEVKNYLELEQEEIERYRRTVAETKAQATPDGEAPTT